MATVLQTVNYSRESQDPNIGKWNGKKKQVLKQFYVQLKNAYAYSTNENLDPAYSAYKYVVVHIFVFLFVAA